MEFFPDKGPHSAEGHTRHFPGRMFAASVPEMPLRKQWRLRLLRNPRRNCSGTEPGRHNMESQFSLFG